MLELLATPHFERRLRQFQRQHPELQRRLARLFEDLAADPFAPRLELHPLHGGLAGLHAVSLNYPYRITLVLRLTKSEIVLHDIGTHNEVYG